MQVVYYLLGFVGVWLLLLSIITLWMFLFFRRLTAQVEKGNLIEVLSKVLEKEKRNEKFNKALDKEIKRLDLEGVGHVRKIGLVRFNPFKEMGGDHSFSLAVLDGNDTGIVLTGLHTRERTRIYAKNIVKGKSDIALSNEEKKALSVAQK